MTNPKNNQQIPQIQTEVEVQTETPSSLDNAPDEIKLAVDLIYLLESNEVDKETAIKALEIVLSDFKNK
ncbi:pleiotropic regulatory protein RsmS [Aliivibrio fischeri]|nr:pleiotropic regulatory protein RsmS [Aliivibrio fischeri]MUL10087.1 pleiotropic regulatory protein RsmS [Aliivibrio fischeri]MUL14796.1 pleiotropic regulatory protein RsmS [Aliivibrio fischeri]